MFQINHDGDRLVALCQEGKNDAVALYSSVSGEKIKYLTDRDKEGIGFGLHSLTRKVCTASKTSAGDISIQTWSIDDGILLKDRNINAEKFEYNRYVSFLVGWQVCIH